MTRLVAPVLYLLIPLVAFSQKEPPPGVDLGSARQIMSAEQAIHEIFGKDVYTAADTVVLSPGLRDSLSEQLHRPVQDSILHLWEIYSEASRDHLVGYALRTEEYGKYRPITMLTGIASDGTVSGVRILIYRESRGGEVSRKRFLHQYRGKNLDDPIRMNRDIINISGATISVRAVNGGVRKSLALSKHLFRNE